MGWAIPIYRVVKNGQSQIFAYLKPVASEAFSDELERVYNYIDSLLKIHLNSTDDEYDSEKLSLYFLKIEEEKYYCWKPNNQISKINFFEGAPREGLEPTLLINIPEIQENFPHIFWEKTEKATNTQQD